MVPQARVRRWDLAGSTIRLSPKSPSLQVNPFFPSSRLLSSTLAGTQRGQEEKAQLFILAARGFQRPCTLACTTGFEAATVAVLPTCRLSG
jgi:hypothetical protein